MAGFIATIPVIEVFGAIAVSLMALFYALEKKHRIFVLLFAFACLASSIYAFAIQSWPFAIIELVWFGIAFWRWFKMPIKTA
ncbi:MAG: hypothetical protein JKY49_17575 [Cohaesibacteraceae bacterium]|nr:hypothetical protein [Cohaesibacteraceae bacterium]